MTKITEIDEFTGISAQSDPDFLGEGGDFSAEGLVDIENAIADFTDEDIQADEFLKTLDYDKFLILSKKELTEFIRIVEPWTKVSPDLYGKSVMIETVDSSNVLIKYINHPTYLQKVLTNRSGKECPTFFVQVDVLKKIVNEAYASVVFVYENDEINITLLDHLLYVQTVKLNESEYKIDNKAKDFEEINTEQARILFKRVSPILMLTDRISEKNIIFKDDLAYLSTGLFSARLSSPFEGKESLVLYKPIVDVLATIVEQSKTSVVYNVDGETLTVKSDSAFFCTKISTDLEAVFNPKIDELLSFDGDIQLMNNSLSRIVSVVKSFDYLSDVLSISVENNLFKVTIYNADLTRPIDYKFPILSDKEHTTSSTLKVAAAAIKPYLDITGDDVKYSFTEAGFGLDTEYGKFLIRRKS